MYGAITPFLPEFSEDEIKKRVLSPKYKSLSSSNNKEKSIKRLKNLIGCTKKEANKILADFKNVDFPLQAFNINKSEMSLGVVGKYKFNRTTFWSTANFNDFDNEFIIPNYEKMGVVFDQGQRGI